MATVAKAVMRQSGKHRSGEADKWCEAETIVEDGEGQTGGENESR